MQGVFTGTKVEGIPTTNLMAKNLKKVVQNSHCTMEFACEYAFE